MTPPTSDRSGPGDPYRYRRGWSAAARMAATQQVRVALSEGDDLIEVSERVMDLIRELLDASRATVTLMRGDQYRDLVNVGELYPGQERIPQHLIYPTSSFPAATARLLAHQGYISTNNELDVVREYIAMAPEATVGCFMGVPIASAGAVLGELWALRAPETPPFLPEDMEMAMDFGTQFGSRLPELIDARRATDPDW